MSHLSLTKKIIILSAAIITLLITIAATPLDENQLKIVTNTLPVTAPSIPILLSPASGAVVSIYAPTFSWSKSKNHPTGYQIQIARDSYFKSLLINTYLPGTKFKLTTPISVSSTYYWRVRAYSGSLKLPTYSSWASRNFKTLAIVTGIATDSVSGALLPNIKISVKGTALSTLTNANGYYQIKGIPTGSYTLIAAGTGFDMLSMTLSVTAGQQYQINFPMVAVVVPPDNKNVKLAWFYKPPVDGNTASISTNYANFTLTRMDESTRDALKNAGVTSPFLEYLRFDEIQDPGSCTAQPLHNQVAMYIGDFCNILTQHPDWFLRDSSGSIINNNDGYFLMDPMNTGWRNFWLDRARTISEQYGWDGIFLDNVEASLDKRIRNGAVPAQYPDNASYQFAVTDFLKFLYTSYFQPTGKPVSANIIEVKDSATFSNYMQYLDGAMVEAFAAGWHDNYISASSWEAQMSRIESSLSLGKKMILITQGSQTNNSLENFSLASYLLVSRENAYFRFTNYNYYNQNWLYNNYNVQLGNPLGARYKVGDSWIRDFELGQVSVNPVANTASIILK